MALVLWQVSDRFPGGWFWVDRSSDCLVQIGVIYTESNIWCAFLGYYNNGMQPRSGIFNFLNNSLFNEGFKFQFQFGFVWLCNISYASIVDWFHIWFQFNVVDCLFHWCTFASEQICELIEKKVKFGSMTGCGLRSSWYVWNLICFMKIWMLNLFLNINLTISNLSWFTTWLWQSRLIWNRFRFWTELFDSVFDSWLAGSLSIVLRLRVWGSVIGCIVPLVMWKLCVHSSQFF